MRPIIKCFVLLALVQSIFGKATEFRKSSQFEEPTDLEDQDYGSGLFISYGTEDNPDFGSAISPIDDDEDTTLGNPWFKNLAEKWNFFEDKAKTVSTTLWEDIQTFYHQRSEEASKLFRDALANFSLWARRGGEYVLQKMKVTFEEAKASELITKLELKLEQGDQLVDEFFQKIGEKITEWSNQNKHANIDDGLSQDGNHFSQHFADPNFPDLFQDEGINKELQKLVDADILTQAEVDELSQSHSSAPKEEKIASVLPETEIDHGPILELLDVEEDEPEGYGYDSSRQGSQIFFPHK